MDEKIGIIILVISIYFLFNYIHIKISGLECPETRIALKNNPTLTGKIISLDPIDKTYLVNWDDENKAISSGRYGKIEILSATDVYPLNQGVYK